MVQPALEFDGDNALVVHVGGPAITGMLPPGAMPASRRFLEATVMGPPIVWLASSEAAHVHDERIIAAEFERWLDHRKAAGEAS